MFSTKKIYSRYIKKKKINAREALLKNARKSFLEKGFINTSMDTLCEEVHLSRGALYHNFGSKEKLLEEVIRNEYITIYTRLDNKWKKHERNPKNAFLETCKLSLKIGMEPVVHKLIFTEGRLILGEKVRELDREFSLEPITSILLYLMKERVIKKMNAEMLALQLNACLMELSFWLSRNKSTRSNFNKAWNSFLEILESLLL